MKFKGVEASLRWTPSTTHTVDFRYTQLHGTEDTVAAGFTKYTFNYPTSSGVFGWQATPRGNFVFRTRVGVIARYAQSRYALWDVYAGLPHKSFHPYIQVSNATNTSYQEIPNVPMPGRTIVGGVEMVFRKR